MNNIQWEEHCDYLDNADGDYISEAYGDEGRAIAQMEQWVAERITEQADDLRGIEEAEPDEFPRILDFN